VETFEFDHKDHKITLIDTPGFNDTLRSEADVLKSIADWLDLTYRSPPHSKLNGILYLQSIMEPRMYGSSLRNLKMFKDLCGEDPLKNVILTTTRWGLATKAEQREMCEEREKQLTSTNDFWKPLIDKGARLARFEDSRESALSILTGLVGHDPVPLQIQQELVDEDKKLVDTTAGNTVIEETEKLQKKYEEELAAIQREMEEALAARDTEVQEALEESREAFEKKLAKVREEQDLLRYERRNESRQLQIDLDLLKAERWQKEKEYEKRIIEQWETQKLEFDAVVEMLEASRDRLRKEQCEALDSLIQEGKKKAPKDRSGLSLLVSVAGVISSVLVGVLAKSN
jgi:hypothetical protein